MKTGYAPGKRFKVFPQRRYWCRLSFVLVWNPCFGSYCRPLTWSVVILLTSPSIEWLDLYSGSCNWWDGFCVCGASGICFPLVAEFERLGWCVMPSSCSRVDVAFVTFGKWLGVLGMGVRVPIAIACFCLTNGFASVGNGGDGWDRDSTKRYGCHGWKGIS